MTTASDELAGPVTLLAAFSSDHSEFLGLLAESAGNLLVRADLGWATVSPDNHYFDGASVVLVDDDFLDFFDGLDAKGTEPSFKQAISYAAPDDSTEEE